MSVRFMNWFSAAVLLGLLSMPAFADVKVQKIPAPDENKLLNRKQRLKNMPLTIKGGISVKGGSAAGKEVQVGTTLHLSAQMVQGIRSVSGKFIKWSLSFNGVRVKGGILPSHRIAEVDFTPQVPGWVAIYASGLNADKKPIAKVYGGIGILVEPEKIRPGLPKPPADFVKYWQKQRELLNRVPVKATLIPYPEARVPAAYRGKVHAYDVKVTCAGSAPVSGYLIIPKKAKKKSLPALVCYHGAGVRSARLRWYYSPGAIVFDVNAHGIANGKPDAFYNNLANTKLKDYRTFGVGNRDTMYFHDMYLRVMRALDYVKSRPEWDGSNLYVSGHSQGGGQALAAAMLDPQITFCIAKVPANGDHNGRNAKRKPGWPYYVDFAAKQQMSPEKRKQVAAAAAYYDNVNFARNIKQPCKVMLSTGFVDFTVPPTAVYAVYNSLPANVVKSMYVDAVNGHHIGNPDAENELMRRIGINPEK